ncbi:MAG: response regulator [Caldilineaceae bacterium]|nr:response regulator [Caldilineaceae bacterium]
MPDHRVAFDRALRTVLNQLYSPGALRASSLIQQFGLADERNPAMSLQRAILAAIESLRPRAEAPYGSRAWRLYQILRRRYTEQAPQNQVALDLGLSTRQLQREEQAARSELAAHLWAIYRLDDRPALVATNREEAAGPTAMPTRGQELAYLQASTPAIATEPGDLVAELVETVAPLATSAHVAISYEVAAPTSPIALQVPLVRQALLDILAAAIHRCWGGAIHLHITAMHNLQIEIAGRCAGERSRPPTGGPSEQLEMAAQLISLCNGVLEIGADGASMASLYVTVSIPAADQATVLVIDDNTDTQHLLRRYLAGTRYRFAGAANAHEGLTLAHALAPHAIVLDVMMPAEDGWSLLGRLREDPQTHATPVIVCTILPQEALARALGAAEFLRKPVSREALLAALGQVISGWVASGVS